MSADMVLERARITFIGHRNPAAIASTIKVVAVATDDAVKRIRARWPLDFTLEGVRATHEVQKISTLIVDSESVTRFKVFRAAGEDGLMVSFHLQHAGSPFELLEHWLKVGEGEGVCTLAPRQTEMFAGAAASAVRGRKGSRVGKEAAYPD